MKKRFFALSLLIITILFIGSISYALGATYSTTLPAWKTNVTLSSGQKSTTGNHAHNEIYMGELDPDCYIWFDYYSNGSWIRGCTSVLQNEGTNLSYALYNSFGAGTTLRLRGCSTNWGPTSYEISGYVDYH